MAISTQYQNLNLIPGKSAPVVVHCSQGNVGDTVGFYLYDGDEPFYPTNVSIAVHGVRADGSAFGPYAVAVTSGSNLVTFELVTAMTSVAGAAIGELVISDSDQNQVGSTNFGILVETTPYSSTVTYEDDLSIYQRILAYVQSIPAELSGQIATEAATREAAINNAVTDIQSQISAEASARSSDDASLQSQISSEVGRAKDSEAALSTRIDQIVAPSGAAPSEAEIRDARIDVNGITHSNLGTAIRTQASNLKSKISNQMPLTDPIYGKAFTVTPSTTSGYYTNVEYSFKHGVNYRVRIKTNVPAPKEIYVSTYNGTVYVDDNIGLIPAGESETQFGFKASQTAGYLRIKYEQTTSVSYTVTIEESIIGDLLDADAFFDLSTAPVQFGQILDLTANTSTNTIANITSTQLRIVVGPFQLGKSVEIYPDLGCRYQLYKRFSNSRSGINFRNMSLDTWQTGKTIEGANPLTETLCNYYLVLCYTDNREMDNESMSELLNHMHVVYVDDNPLGFVEAEAFSTRSAVPIGVGNAPDPLRLVSYKMKFNHDAVFYLSNPDARSTYARGKNVYESATIGSLKYGCDRLDSKYENAVMVQNYANAQVGTIQLKDYSSFKELYEAFGIHCDELIADNTHIEGNQLSDAASIVAAKENGDNLFSQIFDNGVVLNDAGAIKFSHVPHVLIHNGYAYVTFQCDRTATVEFSATTEIELAKINLSNYNDVTYTTIAKQGTYGGVTFSGRCSNPQPCIKDDTIYIPFSGEVNGAQTLCVAAYDTGADTFTINVCNFDYNGTTYVFNTKNFDRYVGGKYGIPYMDYEIIVSPPELSSNVYYSTVTSGAAGQMRTPIVTTTDLINWSIYDILPYEYGGDCECAVIARNGLLYIASRHSYTDSTLRLSLYNIANKTVSESFQIGSTACRPTIFDNNGALVVAVPLSGRRTMQFMQFLDQNISMGRLLATMHSWMGLGYNSIVQDGTDLYFAIQTRKNGATAEDYQHIWFGKSNTVPV